MRNLHLLGKRRLSPLESDVTVRPASPEDAGAIARLAALDSVHLPEEPLLLAEVGDDVRAALSLKDGTVIADPFHPTDGLVELLMDRAAGRSS